MFFGGIEIGARHLKALAGEVRSFATSTSGTLTTDPAADPADEEENAA